MQRWHFAVLFIGLAALAPAQEFRSTLSGSVTDPSGAPVASVKVTGTQIQTNAKYETATATDGLYTLPFLLPGTYRLNVSAPGFKRYQRDGIVVNGNERLRVDIILEVGAVNEIINVTADAALLETASATSGQVIDTRQMESMPLNGRTPLAAAALAQGVVFTTTTTNLHPYDNGGESAFAMGGGAATQNEIMVDGSENTRVSNGQVAYAPPIDAVQEVKVETFSVDAAQGHTGGGTINVIMRGGTNQFHGSAYEFGQYSALNANDWLLNATGQPKPASRQNQFGVTAGGPVIIPKIFNGRNKLFFFAGYEGIQQSGPDVWTLTVPTEAERRGDFSALLALGPQYQIYNPYTAVVSGTTVTRQPFPNNMIPTSLLNPVALNILKYIPLPAQTGLANGQNNYVVNAKTVNTFDSELARVDYNIRDNHKVFFSYRHNLRTEDRLNWWHSPASGRLNNRYNLGFTFDDVYTFSPTLLLDARLNYTRYIDTLRYGQTSFDPAQLGLPASLTASSTFLNFPAISLGAFTSPGPNSSTGATTQGNRTPEDSIHLFTTLTKVTGKHTAKIGADIRQYRQSSVSYGNSTGVYTFDNSKWTNGPLGTAANSPLGQDFASFLLGLPTSGSFDRNAQGAYRQDYLALFIQDDWRFRPNLTLNLGLRYEHDFPTTERYNRNVAGFDFDSANPVQTAAQAAYAKSPIPQVPASQFTARGGLLFANPQNPNDYTPQSHMFSPRIGFAWTPFGGRGKTVLRGGFGIFVFPISLTGINQTGFSQSAILVATNDNYLTPNATLSNPYPGGLPASSGNSLGLGTFTGQSVTFYNPHPVNPYSLRWNLDVQRQFGANYIVEIGYEGNHGVRLPVNKQLNYIPQQYLSTSPLRDAAAVTLLQGAVTNPFAGLLPGSNLNGSTVQRQQLLLPYPEFTGVTENAVNEGGSTYQMGFIRFEKRFSNGLQFLTSFTHSRLMVRTSRLNPQTPLIREVASDDRPNRLVGSTTYDLPFGKGRQFASGINPWVNGVVGGWTASAVYTYQTGAPLGFGNLIYYGGPLNLDTHNRAHTFDITQFDRVSGEQPVGGVNLRTFPDRFNNLRADPLNEIELSLHKNFMLFEHVRLQFRGEFFNLLNHPVFGGPNLSATSTAFGTITGTVANTNRTTQLGLRLVW